MVQCTHSLPFHIHMQRNAVLASFQKGMINVLLHPQFSSTLTRNPMSRIILKALLNVNIYPYDNYVLIMLADNYQQKSHSSEVTKLVGIQQVKTLF